MRDLSEPWSTFQRRWEGYADDIHANISFRKVNLGASVAQLRMAFGEIDRWTGDVAAANARNHSFAVPWDDGWAIASQARAVRLGYALAARDPGAVYPAEALSLADRGFDLSWYRRPANAPMAISVGESFEVSFTYAYEALPPKARSKTVPYRANDGWVRVEWIPSDAFRVACRLETPDGGAIDVLESEGRFYRPVLVPGSWTPIEDSEFAAAAASGEPWVDNPFFTDPNLWKARECLSVLSEVGIYPEGKAASAARAAALNDTIVGVGRILSIGGYVYRETKEPRLTIDVDFVVDAVRLTWVVDGLRSSDVQDVLHTAKCRLRFDEVFNVVGASFPFGCADSARGVALTVAENSGFTFQDMAVVAMEDNTSDVETMASVLKGIRESPHAANFDPYAARALDAALSVAGGWGDVEALESAIDVAKREMPFQATMNCFAVASVIQFDAAWRMDYAEDETYALT